MIVIRKARAADAEQAWAVRTTAILAACVDLYPEDIIRTWAYGELPPTFGDRLAQAGCIAEVDGEMAGFGVLKLEDAKVDGMFVKPARMRQGIGRRLLRRLEAMARAHGLQRLSLDASLNGAPFYRACGYAGEEVSVYHSPRGIGLSCVPMSKELHTAADGGDP